MSKKAHNLLYALLCSVVDMEVDAHSTPTPVLLDKDIDVGHRSFLSAVQHKELQPLRPRPPRELLLLDERWTDRSV